MTETSGEELAALMPGPIIEVGMAFCAAKVLLSAVEFGVFTMLQHGSACQAEISERLGLHPRGAREFLNALVKLNMLERVDGRYRNSAVADHYLVRGKPSYMGNFFARADRVLYPAWCRFTEALRSGKAQIDSSAGENMFKDLYRSPEQMRDFLVMMDGLSGPLGAELARVFDWSRYKSVVDIGGARGNLVANLVRVHPHLDAWVFDLPQVEPAFQEHIAELGMGKCVRFRAGDFFTDQLPQGDVLIFGHVLEDWAPEQRQLLMEKAFEAIRPGGALLVYDPMLDDDLSSLVSLLTSLTMLVVTHRGSEYDVADCQERLRNIGFAETRVQRLGSMDLLVIARKGG